MLSLFGIQDEATKIILNLPKNLIRDYCANPEAPLDSSIDQNTIQLLADINQNSNHPLWESLIVRHYSDIMQVNRGNLSRRDTYLRLARVDTVTELLAFKALLNILKTTNDLSIDSYRMPGSTEQYTTWDEKLDSQQQFDQIEHYNALEGTFSPLADSTITNRDGNSVLALAASAGHLGVVKCLIENGANVNFVRWNGELPLIHSARNGHCDVVQYLIKNGAQVNQFNSDGEPSLIHAARKGYSNVVKCLIENGANLDFCNKNKETALIVAAKNKHTAVIKLLLDNNADANQKDHSGDNVLSIATYMNDIASVRLLLEKGKITSENLKKAIYSAAFYGYTEILALLLSNSPSVDIQDDNHGYTPLARAVKAGQAKAAAFLLARGANINHTTKAAGNILYLAQHGYTSDDLKQKEKNKATMQVLNNACTIEILAHQYGEAPMKSLILYGNAGVLLAVLYHGLKNKAGLVALVVGAGIGLALGLSEDVRDEIDLPTWAISVISVAVSALILLIGNAIIRKSHGPALTFEYSRPPSLKEKSSSSSLKLTSDS